MILEKEKWRNDFRELSKMIQLNTNKIWKSNLKKPPQPTPLYSHRQTYLLHYEEQKPENI